MLQTNDQQTEKFSSRYIFIDITLTSVVFKRNPSEDLHENKILTAGICNLKRQNLAESGTDFYNYSKIEFVHH